MLHHNKRNRKVQLEAKKVIEKKEIEKIEIEKKEIEKIEIETKEVKKKEIEKKIEKKAVEHGQEIKLSPLGKTWILDLDGTIVKHNGYKTDGCDQFLEGAKEFLHGIADGDLVIFITSRTEAFAGITEQFLRENGVRYDRIVYGAPYGERIVVNDRKPSGLPTAVAINTDRDVFMKCRFAVEEDETMTVKGIKGL